LTFAPRELLVVEVEGVRIDVDSHDAPPDLLDADTPSEVEMTAGDVTVKAVAIAAGPGSWDAYIWCTAGDGQARSVTFETNVNGDWQSHTDDDYPFEFNMPLNAAQKSLQFRVHWEAPSGDTFSTKESALSVAR
jgi:hypothetical protein